MAARAPTASVATALLVSRGTGGVGLEGLAREAGIHPDLARRLIALGLVQARGGTAVQPLFERADAALLAQAMRLRRDLGVNWAGAVLACELLARIDELQRRLDEAVINPRREVMTWIPTG